jgi:putative Mn2+ efflux pump MntP
MAIAFGLAADAFSVAMATGLTLGTVTHRQTFRLSFHFGLFQFLMPVIGWYAGKAVEGYIGVYDQWLAFLLVGYVGVKMIYDSLGEEDDAPRRDPTRGVSLFVLSLATSIDAFAVGLGLGLIGTPVLQPSIVIGLVAAGMTFIGLRLGNHVGSLLGRRVETVGGLVLIGIGIKVLVDGLMH